VGDIEEHCGSVAEKLSLYRPKKPKTLSSEQTEQSEEDHSSHSSRPKQSLHSKSESHVRVEDGRKDELLKAMGRLHRSPKSPALSIPYITISKPSPADEEFTVIYFHANSEDIFTSLRIARILSEFYRAKVLIPEYRGYSLLKAYAPDIDLIKADMRFFVKELHHKGVISADKTVLFVGRAHAGQEPRNAPGLLPRLALHLPLEHRILRLPVRGQDRREQDFRAARKHGPAELRQRGAPGPDQVPGAHNPRHEGSPRSDRTSW
jgi:hypothetical protein